MDTVTHPLTPDDIDLEFVALLVPELEVVQVGEDQIVLGGPTQLAVLNPTAALVFQFLDGDASLGELVDDFTDALGVDRAVVEDDVITFVRDLGVNGLLEGVALPPPELPEGFADLDWTPPEPIAIGDELDDFVLPDLDGDERSLSEFRGKRVLLVNWSPGCGFCVKIAGELAALQPVLAEHDVALVFVTVGDAETNRAIFGDVEFDVPTLSRDGTTVDPFAGTGTPAAYLLDEAGRLLESMVVGADQVPVLARDLAGVDVGTPYGSPVEVQPEPDDEEVRGRYLPAPGAMCGPGGGAGGSNSTEWQGTRAYALGGHHVGVRYDTPETAVVLDRLFAGARVNDRRVPDNYSVALGGTPTTKAAGTSRSLKLLVHGSTQLVRSRSGGRVLAALLQYLSGDLDPPDESLTRVNATAVLREGEALLLPAGLVNFVKQLQPRLAKARMSIVDTPRVLLDLPRRELVVAQPAMSYDGSVLAELDEGVQLGNELPWARPGRYPLRAWFLTRGPEHTGPLSPAVAIAAALPLVAGVNDLRGEVEGLAEFFRAVAPLAIWYESADDLVNQVASALD